MWRHIANPNSPTVNEKDVHMSVYVYTVCMSIYVCSYNMSMYVYISSYYMSLLAQCLLICMSQPKQRNRQWEGRARYQRLHIGVYVCVNNLLYTCVCAWFIVYPNPNSATVNEKDVLDISDYDTVYAEVRTHALFLACLPCHARSLSLSLSRARARALMCVVMCVCVCVCVCVCQAIGLLRAKQSEVRSRQLAWTKERDSLGSSCTEERVDSVLGRLQKQVSSQTCSRV